MLILSDSNWVKAKARVMAMGHDEEENPSRFETLVRAAYEDERRRGHILIKGSRLKRFILMKSIGMQAPMPYSVKKKPVAGIPMVTGWAQGQRPDQKAPVHGKIINIGKDGIVIRDDRGRSHRIRHEHIIEHQPPLGEKDWPKAAKALADSGEKIDPVSRFLKKPGRARPDAKQKRRLNTLGKKFPELDVKRVLKEASVDEVGKLIEHYSQQPLRKSIGRPFGSIDGDDPEYLRHAPCMECDHQHRLPPDVRSTGREGHFWENCGGHGGCGGVRPFAACNMCGHAGVHRPEDQAGFSCTKCPECRQHIDVPDRLPDDIQNMKSQSVYRAQSSRANFTHTKDGPVSHIVRERPDRPTKILGRGTVGRIPFVTVHTEKRPHDLRLTDEQWEARKHRSRNVRTRAGAYMDPTESSVKRIRRLAGNIKQQHNERERHGS